MGSCARKPFVLAENVGTVGTLLPTYYPSAAWNMMMMTVMVMVMKMIYLMSSENDVTCYLCCMRMSLNIATLSAFKKEMVI